MSADQPNPAFRETALMLVPDPVMRRSLYDFGILLNLLLQNADGVLPEVARRQELSWVQTIVAGLLGDLDHIRQWLDELRECVADQPGPEDERLGVAVMEATPHFNAFYEHLRAAFAKSHDGPSTGAEAMASESSGDGEPRSGELATLKADLERVVEKVGVLGGRVDTMSESFDTVYRLILKEQQVRIDEKRAAVEATLSDEERD